MLRATRGGPRRSAHGPRMVNEWRIAAVTPCEQNGWGCKRMEPYQFRPMSQNFNVALEQQFGSNPEFAMIAAAGPTSVSDEFTLPDQNSHVTKEWEHQPYQYTVSKYVALGRNVQLL